MRKLRTREEIKAEKEAIHDLRRECRILMSGVYRKNCNEWYDYGLVNRIWEELYDILGQLSNEKRRR